MPRPSMSARVRRAWSASPWRALWTPAPHPCGPLRLGRDHRCFLDVKVLRKPAASAFGNSYTAPHACASRVLERSDT